MATLVLTSVGTAIGGPIGGAIGAIIGQSVDAALFAPKKRHGPRLGDLSVQTSSYGTQIPKLFGTMRVAGTVIWSTDLIERRSTSSGGKGRTKTANYSYSASFAVALSGRPIRTVRRIWADGKLLRGGAGDFKSRTKYRLYTGSEEQEPDPLIASAEGIGQTPAFRGVAYAVFEDFQLEDYGNRIPSLTFEVEADAGPVAIGRIAEALGEGAVAAGATPEVVGYAASGDSVRGALEALSNVVPLSLTESEGRLKLAAAGGEPVLISSGKLGASTEKQSGKSEFLRQPAGTVPGVVTIAYHDVERDYQSGLQRASGGGAARREDRRALPAALHAGAAKAWAEHRLAHLWAGRTSGNISVPIACHGLRPGMRLRLADRGGIWKVRRYSLERMAIALELIRVPPAVFPGLASANPGRPIGHPDFGAGETIIRLFDLPLWKGEPLQRLQLLAMAAGTEPGWRRAELMSSHDDGASWEPAGSTAAPAILGTALTALGPGGSALFDHSSSLDVELFHAGMWLESRSDPALIGGANLAVIGNELVQFGKAEPLGGRRFRLSRLLRGRRGSEWAALEHVPGEAFALIEQEAIAAIEGPLSLLGREARLLAMGIGDAEGVDASQLATGEALRPPSPVHLRAIRLFEGDLEISWVRRSRHGWTWLSGEAPLGEESENYRLLIEGEGFRRVVSLSAPHHRYSAAQQSADGAAGPVRITVVQVGTLIASRPAGITIEI